MNKVTASLKLIVIPAEAGIQCLEKNRHPCAGRTKVNWIEFEQPLAGPKGRIHGGIL
jgi:hypothetical protein